jgi:hypothetical protein
MKRKLQGKAPLFLRLAGMLGEPFIAGHVTWRHACRICRRVVCIASRDCGVPLPLAFVVRCVITHEASSLKVRGCAEKSFCRRVGTAGLATDTMFRQPDQYARNRTARVHPRTQGRASARAVALGEELSSFGPQYCQWPRPSVLVIARSLEPRANCWQASEWTQKRGRHGAPLQAVNTTCPRQWRRSSSSCCLYQYEATLRLTLRPCHNCLMPSIAPTFLSENFKRCR